MNTQPIEKKIKNHSGEELEIVNIFKTIQGEGPFTGHPAIFVRLAGCNLQCPGCDTDYTSKRRTLPIQSIISTIRYVASPPMLIVISGGEPFRQNISMLANTLHLLGHRVQIETNGTLPPSPNLHEMIHIVCSPKAGKVNQEIADRATCFKYVLHADSVDPEDGLPIRALEHSANPRVARPPQGKTVYLQPMDSYDHEQNLRNRQAVVNSCLEFNYIFQLQVHKLIGVE